MSKRKERPTVENGGGLRSITPLTDAQVDVFDSYAEQYNLFLYGVAGTGKTFVALYLAIKEVLSSRNINKVVLVRSVVPARDVGFLPGTLKEKIAIFEAPYPPMLAEMFGRGSAYQELVQKEQLEFVSTSHMRGLTFENCIIVADEIQNYTFQELDTLMTRVGRNCRIIFCGDLAQTDLKNKYDTTGFPLFFSILKGMDEFDCIEFRPEDIVRSGLVKSYILSKLAHEKMAATSS